MIDINKGYPSGIDVNRAWNEYKSTLMNGVKAVFYTFLVLLPLIILLSLGAA